MPITTAKWFITRLELHDVPSAEWHDIYQQLHAEMAKQLFNTTIIANNGTHYHLPHAMYSSSGTLEAEAVRSLALLAIQNTQSWARANGKKATFTAKVLVIDAAYAAWDGLVKVG